MSMFGDAPMSSDKITNDIFAPDLTTWTWSQPTIAAAAVTLSPIRDHQCTSISSA
ncbi:hypothetical protein F5H01DRAFT_364860 [Linnemannia elongata]|nr:hypothetical protein F5H01DRAFT_364860 [Linnemannia elongata]